MSFKFIVHRNLPSMSLRAKRPRMSLRAHRKASHRKSEVIFYLCQDFSQSSLTLKRYLSYLGIVFLEFLQGGFVSDIQGIPKILRYCAPWFSRLLRPFGPRNDDIIGFS